MGQRGAAVVSVRTDTLERLRTAGSDLAVASDIRSGVLVLTTVVRGSDNALWIM
ncbi:hypothetical protein GCM10023324_32460 [Streptomyces youssoufiensis]